MDSNYSTMKNGNASCILFENFFKSITGSRLSSMSSKDKYHYTQLIKIYEDKCGKKSS